MEPSTGKRSRGLALLVPDSGRTWSVNYDQIRFIEPERIELGDVFIVRNPPKKGVTFMQVTAPHRSAWKFEILHLQDASDKVPGA